MGRPTYFCHLLLTCCYPRKKLSCHFPFGSATFFSRLRTCRGERRSAHTVAAMYFSHGGSIRFAAGFVAGVLLREAAARPVKRPPKSLLVPIGGGSNSSGEGGGAEGAGGAGGAGAGAGAGDGGGGGDGKGKVDGSSPRSDGPESGPLVLVRQLQAADHDKGFLDLLVRVGTTFLSRYSLLRVKNTSNLTTARPVWRPCHSASDTREEY
jgi:hypothetical protein